MSNFKTPLQKQLDAKHKKNTLASNRYINKSWFNGFTIQSSNNSDINMVENDRYERIQNYKNSIGAK
jgi:hypothetical protein